MPTTAELLLSPAYRCAQRTLAAWLDQASVGARLNAFAVRATLVGLNPSERGQLARWMAWLCVAAGSRGDLSPIARIRRLDSSLYANVQKALDLLPAAAVINVHRQRIRA